MRVADKTRQRNYLKYLNKARNDYAETNMKIASGNRFIKLSEDVSAGTRLLNSRVELFKSEKSDDISANGLQTVHWYGKIRSLE